MPEQIIALGIGPGGRPVPIRLTDAGSLSVSGGAGAGQGALAVNGVLLLGLNTQGRFVPMAVDENGILSVGVGDTTIINYLNANYITNTYLTDNYYTATYINNTYISNTLVTLKGQLIGGKGSHDVGALGPGSEGQIIVARAAEVTGLKFETQKVAIPFIIDGGGSAITTGVKGDIEIPFAGTITAVRVLADQSGSIVVDIWKDTYANFPPTVADTITASAKPTLSSAAKSEDTTLTGWTKAVAAGSILRFNVDSATTVTRVLVSITMDRA